MEVDRNGLEVLSRQECLALLHTTPIGRLAVTSGALPTILPVNFVIDGESVVIQTSAGSKLDAATRHAVVAFEADHIDPMYHEGWSVVVTGVAREIVDPDEVRRVEHLPLTRWPPAKSGHYVRIPIELVSGRRLTSGVAAISSIA